MSSITHDMLTAPPPSEASGAGRQFLTSINNDPRMREVRTEIAGLLSTGTVKEAQTRMREVVSNWLGDASALRGSGQHDVANTKHNMAEEMERGFLYYCDQHGLVTDGPVWVKRDWGTTLTAAGAETTHQFKIGDRVAPKWILERLSPADVKSVLGETGFEITDTFKLTQADVVQSGDPHAKVGDTGYVVSDASGEKRRMTTDRLVPFKAGGTGGGGGSIEATYGAYEGAVQRRDSRAERMVAPLSHGGPVEATYQEYQEAIERNDPMAERMVKPLVEKKAPGKGEGGSPKAAKGGRGGAGIAGVAGLVAPAVVGAAAAVGTYLATGSVAEAKTAGEGAAEDTGNVLSGRKAPEGARSRIGRAAYKAMDWAEEQGNRVFGINQHASGEPKPSTDARPQVPIARPAVKPPGA
jgi:hypothetical protein